MWGTCSPKSLQIPLMHVSALIHHQEEEMKSSSYREEGRGVREVHCFLT